MTKPISEDHYLLLSGEAVDKIREILWPKGDVDHEWDAGTLSDVAEALTERGLGPRRPRIRRNP